jgi:hypothetical protein
VVHDRVKADLGQRMAQRGRGMVERLRISRKIGPKIDHRDGASIGHGSAGIQERQRLATQESRLSTDGATANRVAAIASVQSSPDQAVPCVM